MTPEQLVASQFQFRTGRDDPKLEWTFTETQTVIKTLEEQLPADLVGAFDEPQGGEQSITASWTLNGEQLTLSNIQIDDRSVDQERTFRAFNTPILRIQVDTDQYVFERKPSP